MPDPTCRFPIDADRAGVERFAGALDALVTGTSPPPIDDVPLARLATAAERIQRIDGVVYSPAGPLLATRIDAARRNRIWEDLMKASSPPVTTASPGSARALPVPALNPWVADTEPAPDGSGIGGPRRRASSTGLLRFVPDIQPAVTFLMVIALLVAIGAGFSSLGQPGGPSVTPTASATGDGGIAAQASPEADSEIAGIDAPFVDPNASVECDVEPRPLEEVAAFLRDPGPLSERAYLPANPADPKVAVEIARAGRTYSACGGRERETPRKIFENPVNTYYKEAGGGLHTVGVAERKALSKALLDPDPRTYGLMSDSVWTAEEALAAEEAGEPPQIRQIMLPSHMVRLADGRIGGPVSHIAHPEGADIPEEFAANLPGDTPWRLLTFLIFAPDASRGGQWALDESLWLCTGDCDAQWVFEAQLDPTLLPAASCPVAPLTSDQVAAIRNGESTLPERQYAPVTTADVTTASAVRSASDLLGQCAEERERDPSYAYAFMTDRRIRELPHGAPWTEEIERRRAVSAQYGDALLGDQPSQEELDLYLNIYTTRDQRFVSDFGIIGETDERPQIVRTLPDGRAALYSADVWLHRMGVIRVPGAVPGREVFFYTIFANQSGAWRVDESLAICLGDCDSFWASEYQAASSPEFVPAPATPSSTPAATPEAITRDPARPLAGVTSHFVGVILVSGIGKRRR